MITVDWFWVALFGFIHFYALFGIMDGIRSVERRARIDARRLTDILERIERNQRNTSDYPMSTATSAPAGYRFINEYEFPDGVSAVEDGVFLASTFDLDEETT